MATDAADAQPAVGTEDGARAWMRLISAKMSFLSAGDRAVLRRIGLNRSHVAAGAIVKLLHDAGIPASRREHDFERWQLIAHIAAVLSGTGAVKSHSEDRRLGEALADAGLSENRLNRLLSSRSTALDDQVRLAARMLAQKGAQPVNLWTFYHLLSADRGKAEAARIRIAQSFYAAKARSAEGASDDD